MELEARNGDENEFPPALIAACVLGAILFLVASISILYWWLSRNRALNFRWARGKPTELDSEYPFSSSEAAVHPTSSTSASANNILAATRPPGTGSDEIFAMRPVGLALKLGVATPFGTVTPTSGSQNSVWASRNPSHTPRPRRHSSTERRKNGDSNTSGSKASASTSNSHGNKRRPSSRPRAFSRHQNESNGGGTTTGSSVAGTQTVSSISFAPATERQMELDERIEEMKGKLALFQRNAPSIGVKPVGSGSISIAKMTHDHRVMKWKRRIEKLTELKESEWALGLTDKLPPGLYEGKGSDDLVQP